MARLEDERLFFQEPDIDERRTVGAAAQHLLVWGQLPAWMVVDDELRTLLRSFDGLRSVRDLLQQHARRERRRFQQVVSEALPILEDLYRRRILSRVRRVPPPEQERTRIASVTVNLTNRCNLNCPFCYNARRPGAELEIGRIMDGIGRDRDMLTDDASFIVLGGEPFLELDRLCEAIARAEGIFSSPTLVSTNGTLLDESSVARLRKHRVQVQVSLDSPHSEGHDAIRGHGVYTRVLSSIRLLKEAGVYTILSLVYTRRSIEDLEAYLDLALELGVDEARFIPLRMIGGGLGNRELQPNQLEALERVLDILGRRPELKRLLARDYFSILAAMFHSSTPRTSCGLGRKVVFIDADGSVYLCPNHVRPDQCAGNLRDQGLRELVLESAVFCSARERYNVVHYQRCRSCTFRYWCAGDCRGEVLALGGEGTEPSPHCEELRKVYLRILWLIAGEQSPFGHQAKLAGGGNTVDSFR